MAAVAAPAREKRESILTPKMAALKIAKASKLPKVALHIPDVEAKPGEPRRSLRLIGKDQKTNRTKS